MRLLVLSAVTAALAGCGVVPCALSSQCPPVYYCDVDAPGGGRCMQDCVVAAQCGPGMTCTGEGRCRPGPTRVSVRITEPAAGTPLSAGSTVTVAGRVTVGLEPVEVTLETGDTLGCVGAAPRSQSFPAQGAEQELEFRFEDVPIGERGGRFSVHARAGAAEATATQAYTSDDRCPSCALVSLREPTTTTLPDHALTAHLAGLVDDLFAPAQLVSIGPTGTEHVLATMGGDIGPTVLPIVPGLNRVGIRVRTPEGGERLCARIVDGKAAPDPLAVHLGWAGEGDLDLQVVPPGATVGSRACRAGAPESICQFPTGDVTSRGPEAALFQSLQDGVYGVVVLSLPSDGDRIPAALTVTGGGQPLLLVGPRELDPARAQSWVAARVRVVSGLPVVEVINRVQSGSPAGSPDSW